MSNLKRFLLLALISVLTACAGSEPQIAAPPQEQTPGVKIGNPYKIAGKWYTPKADPDYNQVGIASWYGADFHNKKTANGETYNMNALTAAHTTLPMPSFVRVTNLENNRSLILRVNDRGPFVNNRLIDVSRRAAQLLGFEKRGTTRVRVQAVPGPDAPVQISRPADPPPLQKQEVGQVAVETLDSPLPPAPQSADPVPVQMASVSPVVKQGDDLYIQVGAYSDISRASRVIGNIGHLGDASMEGITIGGRKLYRVRIGPMYTDTSANSALQQVLKLGHNTAKLIYD